MATKTSIAKKPTEAKPHARGRRHRVEQDVRWRVSDPHTLAWNRARSRYRRWRQRAGILRSPRCAP
jgi:hypothetical protein